MNINQTLAAVALVILTLGGALAAYGLRYVPMGGEGMMWDRWERQACFFSIQDGYSGYCGRTNPVIRR